MTSPEMKFTPTLIVCEACSNSMHVGHVCRQFVPFQIEVNLRNTVASLPKRLRKQITNGASPYRGQTHALVPSTSPEFVDELVRLYAAKNPVTGVTGRTSITMIARFMHHHAMPAWVIVHNVWADSPSVFASFLFKTRLAIGQAKARGIVSDETIDHLFIDGIEKRAREEKEARERKRAELETRALKAARTLRGLTDIQIAALAAEDARLVEALETLLEVPHRG